MDRRWRRPLLVCFVSIVLLLTLPSAYSQPGSSFANAEVISSGSYTYNISPSVNHYFKFEAKRGQTVEVTLTMQKSDLNLYLYNEAQIVVASSAQANVGLTEDIRFLVKASGYYYIRVENKLPIQDAYTLTLNPASPGATIQDALTILDGTYNYTISSRGEHYYKISCKVEQTLTLRLTPSRQLDVSLAVYGPDRVLLASSDRVGAGGAEALQISVDVEGDYYLKVSNLGEISGVYSLTVNLVRVDVVYVGWGSLASPIEVDADETAAPLVVNVRLGADMSLTNLEGELHLRTPFSDPLGRSSLRSVCNFTLPPAGGLAVFTYKLNIADSARKGFYTLPLTIRYHANQPDGLVYRNPVNVTVQVPITGRSRVEVNADLSGLEVDTLNSVRFTFSNLGSADISALRVAAAPSFPLIIVGVEAEWEVGALKAGEASSVVASIYAPPSAAGGTYSITLSISYRNSVGSSLRESRSISFYVSSLREAEIELTAMNQSFTAGKVNTLLLKVKNNDRRKIDLVQLSLTLTPPLRLEGKDNLWQVKDLLAGESRSITVEIYAPSGAAGQTFQISATLTYRITPNVPLVSARSLSISVKEAEAPYVVVEGLKTDLLAGGSSSVKIRVANNSTSILKSVEATLTLPTPLTASVDRWRFSTLAPSEETVLQMEVYAPASASAATFTSKLALTFYDEDGFKFTEVFTIGLVASRSIPEPLLTLRVEDNVLAAGEIKQLKFKVANVGESTAYLVEASAATQPPLTILSGARQSLGDLGVNAETYYTVTAKAPFDVLESAVPLTFTFTYTTEGGQKKAETQQTTLILTKNAPSVLLLDYTPKEIVAGGAEEVKVSLTNHLKSSLRLLELRFTPSSAAIQLGGLDYASIDSVDANSTVTVPIRLYAPRSALGSTGTLTLTARFITQSGDPKSETYSLGFYISGSRQSGVKLRLLIDDYDLYATQINEVKFRLKNLGDEDANRVSASLRLSPSLSLIGDSGNWYFDDIKRGGEVQITVRVFAPKSLVEGEMQANTAQATLVVRYLDSSGIEWVEELTSGLTVRGNIDLRVSSLSVRPEAVAPFSQFTVSGVVYNGGIVAAKSVNVTALATPPFLRTFSDSTILGEIPKDGQSSFSLTLRVGDAAPATYPLNLVISYRDDRGQMRTVNATIQVNIAEQVVQKTQQPLLLENPWLMTPIAFVIGVLVSWLALRRRGKRYLQEEQEEKESSS